MTHTIRLTPSDLRKIIEDWARERYRGEVTEITFDLGSVGVGCGLDKHSEYRFIGATVVREVE